MMSVRPLFAAALVAVLSSGVAQPLSAQVPDESRLLREAAARESRGDFDGAQGVLLQILEANPVSSGGLFALERVLRSKGTMEEILPVVDAFLAQDPGSSGVRYLKLRVLVEVDSLDALRDEAEAWFRLDPESPVSYREVSRVYERAFGSDEALEVLRRGRRALGDDDALAMEIGDLLAPQDPEAAVREWGRAVGDDGSQATAVARRVAALPPGAEDAARDLVEALGESDLLPRRRAGAEIALTVGLEEEAGSFSVALCAKDAYQSHHQLERSAEPLLEATPRIRHRRCLIHIRLLCL
jgi:tetratricopeptide (TPR) repeat protein